LGRCCASSLEHPQRAPGSHDCRDNGDSLDSAKSQTSDFNDRRLVGWAHDALNDWFEEREADGRPVPYNAARLVDAISLDYESGYQGRGDLEITFDDDAQKNPEQCACRGPDEVGRRGQRRGRCSRRCRPG